MQKTQYDIFVQNSFDPSRNNVVHERIDNINKISFEEKIDDSLLKKWDYDKNQLKKFIIRYPSKVAMIRRYFKDVINHSLFLSQIEPKTIKEALNNHYQIIIIMEEELNQFIRNIIQDLILRMKCRFWHIPRWGINGCDLKF